MSLTDFSQLTPFEPIDVIGDIRENILVQYQDSPNLLSYIEALLTPLAELENVFIDILNLRLISQATGEQLDILGDLVVQPRAVYDTSEFLFFGMDFPSGTSPVAHSGLGTTVDGEDGGTLRDIEQAIGSRTSLNDDDYRSFILSKATKNTYTRGVESLIEAIQVTIPTEPGEIEISSDFTTLADPFVLIKINRVLSSKEKSFFTLTDILPRPAGMRYVYEDSTGPF